MNAAIKNDAARQMHRAAGKERERVCLCVSMHVCVCACEKEDKKERYMAMIKGAEGERARVKVMKLGGKNNVGRCHVWRGADPDDDGA